MSTPMALAFCAAVIAIVLTICGVAWALDRRNEKKQVPGNYDSFGA